MLKRLLSPAGFLLVLLCFFLPFVSISCQSAGFDISADYSGLDVMTNGEPSTSIPPELANMSGPAAENPSEDAPTTDAQLWAILTAVIVAVGLLASLVATGRARRMVAIVCAGVGAVLLVVTQIIAQGNLGDKMWAEASKELSESDAPGGMGDIFNFSESTVRDMTGWEIGFLLALLLLLVVLLGNVGALTYPKWKRFVPAVRLQPAAAQAPPGADLPTPSMGIPRQSDVPDGAQQPDAPRDTPPDRPTES